MLGEKEAVRAGKFSPVLIMFFNYFVGIAVSISATRFSFKAAGEGIIEASKVSRSECVGVW